MPLPRPSLRPGPLLALLPLLVGACATAPGPKAPEAPPAAALPAPPPRLVGPDRPAGKDVLADWRTHFDAFFAAFSAIEMPLVAHESADSPLPELLPGQFDAVAAQLENFKLPPGAALVFAPINGPETPFPDHHPLRQIASARTVQARLLLAAGDTAEALSLVRQNLAQARATLRAQEGIIPLIHSLGVWQCALDGAHALARSPTLAPTDARDLLAELLADSTLAQTALDRALRGEYAHVYRVIVERMPVTDDPDLALSSVSSLGMSEPEALAPGELGLGLTTHLLLDREQTLRDYEADLAPYLEALRQGSRLPRGLYARSTWVNLGRYQRELGAFHQYASGEDETTLDLILRARAAMESTPNPIGKLLAVYLTPPWEVMFATALRREAQRSALCGLLAWRIHGSPAAWEELVAAAILPAAPADPFSDGALRFALGDSARVWSVYLDEADNGGKAVEGNIGQPADLVWLW